MLARCSGIFTREHRTDMPSKGHTMVHEKNVNSLHAGNNNDYKLIKYISRRQWSYTVTPLLYRNYGNMSRNFIRTASPRYISNETTWHNWKLFLPLAQSKGLKSWTCLLVSQEFSLVVTGQSCLRKSLKMVHVENQLINYLHAGNNNEHKQSKYMYISRRQWSNAASLLLSENYGNMTRNYIRLH